MFLLGNEYNSSLKYMIVLFESIKLETHEFIS